MDICVDIAGSTPLETEATLPVTYVIGADADEIARIKPLLKRRSALVGVMVEDWNAELSPWSAPGLRKGEDFAGGADNTIKWLAESAVHAAESELRIGGFCTGERFVAGYSLGGLFAVYAATKTDMFAGAASISGSMWYDGFCGYLENAPLYVRAAYFSLGDAEPKARNVRLAEVGRTTLRARDIMQASGIFCEFEWNSGNHFVDSPLRTARGIDWLIEKCPRK